MLNNSAELKGDGLPHQSERPQWVEAHVYSDDHHRHISHHYVANADEDYDDGDDVSVVVHHHDGDDAGVEWHDQSGRQAGRRGFS